MKSIGFFLAVFISMLTVFLVATGEVKRWFTPEPKPTIELGEVKSVDGRKTSAGNIFEFPFYDVNRAELQFVIRAEFIQDELSINSPIDKIDKLTLRNGVIEVPFSGEIDPTAEDNRPNQSNKLTLEFQTAFYEKSHKDLDGENGLQVLLKQGKGTTEDGTQFFFDELSFGKKGPDTYYLRSAKPVSIRNPSFSVLSPTGLDGTLRKHARNEKEPAEPTRQEFQLLPPVSALLNPEPAVRSPSGVKQAVPSNEKPAQLIGVVCQGPLSIISTKESTPIEKDRISNPTDDQGSQSGIQIHFEKDVVIYPVPGATTLEALPAPHGNRFECQKLQVDLENVNGKTVPVHGLATWEGGRVKGYFQNEKNAESLVIDGDRVEWTRTKKRAEGSPKAGPAGSADLIGILDGQAALEGRPVLRSRGLNLSAEKAVFFPGENRLLLDTIEGSLEYLGTDEKEGHRPQKPTEARLEALGIGQWNAEAPEGDDRVKETRSPKNIAANALKAPRLWDLAADEAEIFFAENAEPGGASTTEKTFSKFIARSHKPDGVQIKSRTEKPYQATGSTLTYLNLEKKATLEGSDGAKPRFVQGESWIESERIHVFQEERAVWFENEVLARIDDLATMSLLGGKAQGKDGPAATAAGDSQLEIAAEFLSVRLDDSDPKSGSGSLRDLAATGSRERPVTVTTLSGPWSRFSAQELYWDQAKEVAQLIGRSGSPQDTETPTPEADLARIQMEDGELLSQRILFQQRTWKAFLSDRVLLRSARKDASEKKPLLEMRAGKSEVEFFHGFEAQGPNREGVLKELARIKSIHALQPPDGPIEISGAMNNMPFLGKAEEANWSHETRQLRLHGTGLQEIELLSEGLKGPTRAHEIVFEEEKNLIAMKGEVQGRLLQNQSLPGGRAATEKSEASPGRTVTWAFETNSLEAQLSSQGSPGKPRLETIRARDKVDLRGEELGIQVRGDDLLYDDATKKIRVFSPDGRPQTLVCDPAKAGIIRSSPPPEAPPLSPAKQEPQAKHGPQGKTVEAPAEKVHKIVSQVITLLLYRDPYAVPQRGDTADWLLAEFDKDVIASFYIPPSATGGKRIEGAGDIWKMVAERLTLFVDPSQPAQGTDPAASKKVVPWAAAQGKVVFTTGTLQATADKAVYQEALSRITLYGSPARLSRDNEPVFAEPEISVWREEGTFGAKYSKGDGKSVKIPAIPPAPK